MKKIATFACALLPLATIALSGCNPAKKTILIYSESEEERIAYFKEELSKQFPNYDIVIQYTGTGGMVSRLQGEKQNTPCDIIYDLEANYSQMLLNEMPNLFFEMKDYDFSQFKDSLVSYGHKYFAPTCMSYGGIALNKKVLADRGLATPTTYEDLLNESYKGLISMPNPKSSGTGYFFYSGVISHLYHANGGNLEKAKTDGYEYFRKLSANVKEFTSSGSAPLKATNRGETAIGLGMLFQCVQYKKENLDLDYTFLDYGAPYNLYVSAVISGHEQKQEVKEVWDYLFYTLNKKQVEKLIPDPIYKDMTPEDPDYPTEIEAIDMVGLFDTTYKQSLLDLWTI